MTSAPRVLSQRFVLFCDGWVVVVVGGGGWAVLNAANCHCFSKVRGCLGLGEAFFQAQSLEGGSGPRSREAGLQFRNWKNLGATGHLESAHTEGPASHRQCVPSHRLAPHREGHLRGLFWAWAPDPHSLQSAPSRPSALRRLQQGRSEDMGSQQESLWGTDREGAEWGGMAPTEGGLQLFSKRDRRSSLLLLGRSGGSRYERSSSGFVSSGRSWKKSTEAQMRCWLRG